MELPSFHRVMNDFQGLLTKTITCTIVQNGLQSPVCEDKYYLRFYG